METPITIRAATDADVAFLAESNGAMALETERKRLDINVLTRGTQALLDEPARGFHRIAERSGVRVGTLMVTREWSDWLNADWWWIQSVYVIPQARRSGVFTALYADIEARARSTADVAGLRLYVEKENQNALATYAALGMVDSGYRLLETHFSKINE